MSEAVGRTPARRREANAVRVDAAPGWKRCGRSTLHEILFPPGAGWEVWCCALPGTEFWVWRVVDWTDTRWRKNIKGEHHDKQKVQRIAHNLQSDEYVLKGDEYLHAGRSGVRTGITSTLAEAKREAEAALEAGKTERQRTWLRTLPGGKPQ
jgi:hypothetical protein